MPDKPATVAAYAAGASLAAITLFYVFGPNFTIDGDDSSGSDRKKAIVGLINPANDCFINSVLQALAGLGELRVYLIRELHRRELDGPDIYNQLPDADEVPVEKTRLRPDRQRELQQGTVTLALKEMLDRLNERPIYKKTISARPFIHALEYAYRTRISRNQQDAQEFLQIVAERLCEEYHAGVKARRRARRLAQSPQSSLQPASDGDASQRDGQESSVVSVRIEDGTEEGLPAMIDTKLQEIDDEYGFPFEGQLESQIECQSCHYQYRPNKTSFVNLTLQVPQKSSTTLNACFDGLLKTEYIDDFRCDKCRLLHALETKIIAKSKARSEAEKALLDSHISRIQHALETDPEQNLDDIDLPSPSTAPKRRIARHMRITVFPKIAAIHLSRSIFDQSSSTKNAAKVSFPERLPLGGILNRKWYKLLGIVCHKGSHHSGHYESFRRSHIYPPYSTPDAFRSYAASRAGSANASAVGSPRSPPSRKAQFLDGAEPSPLSISPADSSLSLSSMTQSSPTLSTPTSANVQLSPQDSPKPRGSLQSPRPRKSSSVKSLARSAIGVPNDDNKDSVSKSTRLGSPKSPRPSQDRPPSSSGSGAQRLLRRRKPNERWWRISDEKVKECRTDDVLGMQKEVYLLFYEMEKPSPTSASEWEKNV